jgi:predicted Zn-ribbon and HTH transcriptional regulator
MLNNMQITQILQEGNYPNSIPLRENLKDIKQAKHYHSDYDCKCPQCSSLGWIYEQEYRKYFFCPTCKLQKLLKLLNVK